MQAAGLHQIPGAEAGEVFRAWRQPQPLMQHIKNLRAAHQTGIRRIS